MAGTSNSQAVAWHGSNRLVLAGPGSTAGQITNAGVIAGRMDGIAHLFVPQSAADAVAAIANQLEALVASGAFSATDVAALQTLISAAAARIAAANNTAAINVLGAFNNRVSALVASGRQTQADANTVRSASSELIALLRRYSSVSTNVGSAGHETGSPTTSAGGLPRSPLTVIDAAAATH